jgi:16S rRNA (guanine1207-N2)-methyltransferase
MIQTDALIEADIAGFHLVFKTARSLFSPRYVDAGTRVLLSVVQFESADKVLDLGCGYGVVGILAGKLIDPSRVFMVDNDPLAIECARHNAAANGVSGVSVVLSEGFDNLDEAQFTKIICNPPYHSDFSVAKHLIQKAFNRLDLNGRLFMVTKHRGWYEKKLRSVFGSVSVRDIHGYNVFIAKKKTATWANIQKKHTQSASHLRQRRGWVARLDKA